MEFTYLFASLVISIVMLNLLIAIISKAYEKVIASQHESNAWERVKLIHDLFDEIEPDEDALEEPNTLILRATTFKTSSIKEDDEEYDWVPPN